MATPDDPLEPRDVASAPPGPVEPAGPPRQPFPSWKQALVATFGGLALAVTACFGFLISFGNNFERGGDPVFTPIAAIVFVVATLVMLVGFVLILMRALRGRRQESRAGGDIGPPGEAP